MADIPEPHGRLIAGTARLLNLKLITNDPVIQASHLVKTVTTLTWVQTPHEFKGEVPFLRQSTQPLERAVPNYGDIEGHRRAPLCLGAL
jgi:hypothetical protein